MFKRIIGKTIVIVVLIHLHTGFAQMVRIMQDDRILLSQATAYEHAGRFDLAAESYIELCEKHEQDMNSYLGAKRCLVQLKDFNRLENLIRRLQVKSRDLQFEVDLAEIEYLRGDPKTAVQHWLRIIEENAHSDRAYVLVGSLLFNYQFWDEARAVYLRGRKSFKDPVRYIFQIAEIEWQQKNFKCLVNEFLKYIRSNPDRVPFIQLQFLNYTRSSEEREEMCDILEKSLDVYEDLTKAIRQILGAIYTQGKNYSNALKHYVALEKELDRGEKLKDRGQYLYNLGMAAMGDGNYEDSRVAFNLLKTEYSNSPLAVKAEIALAQIFEYGQDYGLAIEAYQRFIEKYPRTVEAVSAMMRIGDIYLNHLFDLSKAEIVYENVIEKFSGSTYKYDSMLNLAKCATTRGNLEKARAIYTRVTREIPSHMVYHKKAQLSLAKLDVYQGQPKSASQRLDKIVSTRGRINTAQPDLIFNDILDLYLSIQENIGDSLGMTAYGNAQLLALQRRFDESIEILQHYLSMNPYTQLRGKMLLLLVDFYRKLQKPEVALQICDSLLNEESYLHKDLIYKTKGEIHLHEMRDAKLAQSSYETLLENYPDSIYIEEVRKRIRNLEKTEY